jgi:hypothetical protein
VVAGGAMVLWGSEAPIVLDFHLILAIMHSVFAWLRPLNNERCVKVY